MFVGVLHKRLAIARKIVIEADLASFTFVAISREHQRFDDQIKADQCLTAKNAAANPLFGCGPRKSFLQGVDVSSHAYAGTYATACVGKWHLGGTEKYHPERRGFDAFFGFLHEGHTFAPAHYPGLISHLRRSEPQYDEDNRLLRGTLPIDEQAYVTEAITREALAFIDQHRERPFFLYVPYNAVHSPMQTTPKYFDRFAAMSDIHRRVFAAMLAALDDSVGAILAKLREHELEENSLIVFLSDNGGPTAEFDQQQPAAPRRQGATV